MRRWVSKIFKDTTDAPKIRSTSYITLLMGAFGFSADLGAHLLLWILTGEIFSAVVTLLGIQWFTMLTAKMHR